MRMFGFYSSRLGCLGSLIFSIIGTIILAALMWATTTRTVTQSERSEPPPQSAKTSSSAFNLLDGKLIDLTHPFNIETIYWPTENGFRLELGKNGITDKGYYYAANRFTT